jgi:hypothetical protein
MSIENNHRWPSPHHNFVPEYQQSGIPFAKKLTTPNKVQVEFPSVTRWISISSESASYINFHQDVGEDNNNWDDNWSFYIPANTVTRFELKCKVINVKSAGDVYILAGLTNVLTYNFPDQTAANGFAVETPDP